ncbi:Tyrosine decarboxylase [Arachis hypogaea]|nr:Tyrosine decarboxylase [Arachis hypogaea]
MLRFAQFKSGSLEQDTDDSRIASPAAKLQDSLVNSNFTCTLRDELESGSHDCVHREGFIFEQHLISRLPYEPTRNHHQTVRRRSFVAVKIDRMNCRYPLLLMWCLKGWEPLMKSPPKKDLDLHRNPQLPHILPESSILHSFRAKFNRWVIEPMSYSRRSRYSPSPSRPHTRGTAGRAGPYPENSGNNLYVTGLSPRITKRELEKHFAAEGKVIDVHLVVDPWTRESRGFGFVTMANLEDADRCILRTVGKDALLKLVTYASDQTYSSLLKVCQIGGLNPELCRSLKTDASTNYALSPEVFSEAVSRDIASGLIPFFLCATVGTTSSTVPGATTLAEKLNHQGIDVVSVSKTRVIIVSALVMCRKRSNTKLTGKCTGSHQVIKLTGVRSIPQGLKD